MGLCVEMVVSIFVLRGEFLVERMLDRCESMWDLNMASEIGVYVVTCFTFNSGQNRRKRF